MSRRGEEGGPEPAGIHADWDTGDGHRGLIHRDRLRLAAGSSLVGSGRVEGVVSLGRCIHPIYSIMFPRPLKLP